MPGRRRATDPRLGEPLVADDVGTGPVLILVHGLSGSARWWTHNLAALSAAHRVITVDLPGFGASARGHRLVLDEAADRLAGLMDRLGLERASVIGHSMGGLIAGGLAADHPDRVDRLVLVDAAFLSLSRSAARFVTGPLSTLRRTSPSLLPVIAQDGWRSGPLRLTAATIQLLRADWHDRLPRIRAPTLVVWGEHDAICPLEVGVGIASLIPDARLVVVKGAAHNPMWEQPEAFDREVLAFLGS